MRKAEEKTFYHVVKFTSLWDVKEKLGTNGHTNTIELLTCVHFTSHFYWEIAYKSSRPEVVCRKDALKLFVTFTRNHMCWKFFDKWNQAILFQCNH